MPTSSATNNKNKTSVLECQGDYRLSRYPPFVINEKLQNGSEAIFKPWYVLNYQGFLFYYINDRQEGFELNVFIPWLQLASQGILFTIK